jgi:tetratricopeptide (TPR) repeat protein
MRSIHLGAACFILASFSSLAAAADPPLFLFIEKPGPHAVGLKVIEQYDYSRTFRATTDELGKPFMGERARPLQTLIWYPANKSAAKPVTFGDYVNLIATETSFDKPLPATEVQQRVKEMTIAPAAPLWAVRDAQLEPGRFPVVIYAPSFSNTSWENADLCEYLATYGYVVIASPDMGAANRSMTMDLAGVNAQARDISFLISYAQSLPDTDMSEIAVAGYSWGGISNLFAAARDNRIDALVALDGSMRYFPGLVEQAGDVHPSQLTLPLLFFTQGEITVEEQAMRHGKDLEGPSVLNEWTHGDLITIHMLGMAHGEFSSRGQRYEDARTDPPEWRKADYSREDVTAGYGWVARYTLQFLDAYLKHDEAAVAYLKKTPLENGVPSHLMSVTYRAAKGLPATLDSLRAELGRQGFDHAGDVYAAMNKENPDFKLDENVMNLWGYELMAGNHLPEAVAVLKLNVQLYPESENVYDSLGEAYMKSGQKQLAIDNYKKSIEIDPGNTNGAEKLKELQADTTKEK